MRSAFCVLRCAAFVAIHILPQQRDPWDAVFDQTSGFAADFASRHGNLAPSRFRNNAKGATLIAAGHDGQPRVETAVRFGGFAIFDRETFLLDASDLAARLTDLSQDLGKFFNIARPHHQVQIRKSLKKPFPMLFDHTAHQPDDQVRVFFLFLSQHPEAAPNALLGMIPHRASIHENNVGSQRFIRNLTARIERAW